MGFVNKVKKDQTSYDIHDSRLEVTSGDIGKLVGVDNEGNLALVNAPAGGAKLYKHEVRFPYTNEYGAGSITATIICTESSPVTNGDVTLVDLQSDVYGNTIFNGPGSTSYKHISTMVVMQNGSVLRLNGIEVSESHLLFKEEDINISASDVTDTVTEL